MSVLDDLVCASAGVCAGAGDACGGGVGCCMGGDSTLLAAVLLRAPCTSWAVMVRDSSGGQVVRPEMLSCSTGETMASSGVGVGIVRGRGRRRVTGKEGIGYTWDETKIEARGYNERRSVQRACVVDMMTWDGFRRVWTVSGSEAWLVVRGEGITLASRGMTRPVPSLASATLAVREKP